MGYHHLALAARDMAAVHHFYEDVMGFELVKVEVAPVPDGGWAKHFTAEDRAAAVAALSANAPEFSKPPTRIEKHRAGRDARRA